MTNFQQEKLGVVDFIDFIRQGHYEFSLFVVKASFTETIEAFLKFYQPQKIRKRINEQTFSWEDSLIVKKNITRLKKIDLVSIEKYDSVAKSISFVRVLHNEWTIILHSLFDLGMDEIEDVSQGAKFISKSLNTETITLMAEDTSGSIGYDYFKNGDLIETLDFGDWVVFESKLKDKPEIFIELKKEEKEDCYYYFGKNNVYNLAYGVNYIDIIDNFFTELGIYLPACYPTQRKRELKLAVATTSKGTIEKASFLVVD